jgi:hypothetical protein
MGFSLGIVGLPNVGKSTLFNVISRAKADVSNYPFTTIKPNVGVVEVPDERLANIQKIIGSAKAIPTIIEFYDIAGLVKGAHKGEGLGNQFLSHIREVDAIAHAVRCFSEASVTHVEGEVDPKRDIELINAELILADLGTIDKRFESIRSALKSGDKKILKVLHLLEKVKEVLGQGKPARVLLPSMNSEDINLLQDFHFLTVKPILYVANVDESGNEEAVEAISRIAREEKAAVVAICAKLEAEISELAPEEGKEYLKAAGREEFALQRLIRAGYELLDLITFFTANEKECRAWTIRHGTKAPQAAGRVHSDMERGFIAAEVAHYSDLIENGSYSKLREKGLIHTEGKEYPVRDGDLIMVKFSL